MTTDSSVVGIFDLQRRRRLFHCYFRTEPAAQAVRPASREKFEARQPAAGEPASRIIGERDECAAQIGTQDGLGHATLSRRVAQSSQVQCTTYFSETGFYRLEMSDRRI